jgi:CHASE3 domain sensor protein
MKKSTFIISIALTAVICFCAVSTWQWISDARTARSLQDQNQQLNQTIDSLNNQVSNLTVKVDTYGGELALLIGTPG